MAKNILILGNGFDLDLGLKTKYSDFANSVFWPYSDGNSIPNLEKYLEQKRDTEAWFDIENELLNYATVEAQRSISPFDRSKYNAHEDMAYFVKLQDALCKYIQEQQQNEIVKNAVASQVLRAIVNNGYFESVYSFNYTNINIIAKKLGINSPKHCVYIHGNVDSNSIILGVDETKLLNGYEFLHKTMSPHYRSHNIFNDLSVASEVVIFGLSFGKIDYTYLDRFFKSQSEREPIDEKLKKHITIFTKDENSRVDVLNRLEAMGINRQNLYTQSYFQIIRTNDDSDMNLLNEFKIRLREQRKNIEMERELETTAKIIRVKK